MIEQLKEAIAKAKSRPKGVKVTVEMWKALSAAELIQMKPVAAWGFLDLGFELFFYEDIYIVIDPELEFLGKDFLLPPLAS